MTTTPDLPPLPEPMYDARGPRPYGQSYSATQMRTYAAAAVLAEREKAEAMRAALVELVESREVLSKAYGAIEQEGGFYKLRDLNERINAAWAAARAAIRAEPKEEQP